jgi:hypothetical protein
MEKSISNTIVQLCKLSGKPGICCVIYVGKTVKPEMKVGGPRVKIDGKWYDTVYFANEKGGMTAELFPHYIEQCVLPCCTGMGPEPENNHLLLLDGDDSHAIALFKDIARSEACIEK